jgi:endogenous inhibitor of DNA gyrase (YacG/DUF329 family)
MTSPAPDTEVARLPFKVRPQRGEGAASFITRLAQANYLPPAYLRKYLTEPPQHLGRPTWPRIAAAAGRDLVDLQLILNTVECKECGAPIRRKSMFGAKPLTCSRACRQRRHRKRYPASEWRREPCRICGKVMRMQIGQRRPLCSSACRRTAYLERQQRNQQAAEAPSNPEGDSPPACPVCEGPLAPSTAKSRRRTCSQRCRQSAYRWRTRPPRTPDPPRKPEPTLARTCEICEQPLPPGRGQSRRRTCSARCRQRAYRWSGEQRAATTPSPVPVPGPAAPPKTVWARADALALTRNESLESPRCPVCSGPMPEGSRRSQRRTCSQRCRQKAYWRRKMTLSCPEEERREG